MGFSQLECESVVGTDRIDLVLENMNMVQLLNRFSKFIRPKNYYLLSRMFKNIPLVEKLLQDRFGDSDLVFVDKPYGKYE